MNQNTWELHDYANLLARTHTAFNEPVHYPVSREGIRP